MPCLDLLTALLSLRSRLSSAELLERILKKLATVTEGDFRQEAIAARWRQARGGLHVPSLFASHRHGGPVNASLLAATLMRRVVGTAFASFGLFVAKLTIQPNLLPANGCFPFRCSPQKRCKIAHSLLYHLWLP